MHHSDRMNTVKLWVTLLCVCGRGILSLDCDWTTEYDDNNRCCKACPAGEYPISACSQDRTDSLCEKCPSDLTHLSAENRCFCKDKHLCAGYQCEDCQPREKCKPGQQLMRIGNFHFSFYCAPCQNNTYNDVEDSTCKPITKCDGVGEFFPGNQTHNANCVPEEVIPDTTKSPPEQNRSQYFQSLMVACITITVLTCLVFITLSAFQIFKYKTFIKLNRSKLCTHTRVVSSESCKLSKEERGESDHEHKIDLSEDCDHSFP
ncbi:tumor necrosis factor receptor superfamily member 18 isoform X1 [Danio rerio]|uniref:Tumor necrosis factor receptor superfamily member 18 isoform X1 n=1 Tax=Danio rerio TaxID=7955 RepID=A0ACD6B5N2_DANRE